MDIVAVESFFLGYSEALKRMRKLAKVGTLFCSGAAVRTGTSELSDEDDSPTIIYEISDEVIS